MSRILDAVVAQTNTEQAVYGAIFENWSARFKKHYGWRAGEAYTERDASIADVIRHETDELENDLTLHAPFGVLAQFRAKDACWLCPTRQAARHYGTPYKVELSPNAFIAASDHDNGYLVIDTGENT